LYQRCEVYGVPKNLHGVLRRELFMNGDFADSLGSLLVASRTQSYPNIFKDPLYCPAAWYTRVSHRL
jgi:hypothetical protein